MHDIQRSKEIVWVSTYIHQISRKSELPERPRERLRDGSRAPPRRLSYVPTFNRPTGLRVSPSWNRASGRPNLSLGGARTHDRPSDWSEDAMSVPSRPYWRLKKSALPREIKPSSSSLRRPPVVKCWQLVPRLYLGMFSSRLP